MSARTLLLTGASGFAGRHLAVALAQAGWQVRAAVRTVAAVADLPVVPVQIGDLAAPIDWQPALEGVQYVVHGAGLAHAGGDLPEELYQRVNTQATLDLAAASVTAGVQRFIYLSSIKAQTGLSSGAELIETDLPAPDDAYGRSKLVAEQRLATLDLNWIALRPVLIYGPGVKANMAALIRLARLPIPLPFGAANEPRSLLALENLASAVLFALGNDCPARRAYIVADPEPVTLAQMITALRAGMGRKPGLIPVPAGLMRSIAGIIGQADKAEKLLGGLVARPTTLIEAGWLPPVTSLEGLARLTQINAVARRN
jgi:nucleoside-diphosphate-sugar epimerase